MTAPLNHLAFFEALAEDTDQSSPAWLETAAGLLVLRLYDAWIKQGGSGTGLEVRPLAGGEPTRVLAGGQLPEPPLSLAGDDEGFWIGTQSGLVRYRPATGEWQRFGPEDGLAGAPVLHLMAEEDAVWASSRSGVTRFGWRGAGR